MQQALFGGGCFWCTEAVFLQIQGVQQVVSGYAGGHTTQPNYDDVCGGNTGHAEVVNDSRFVSWLYWVQFRSP